MEYKLTRRLIPCYNGGEAARSPAGRKQMALGLYPLFSQKGVIIMSDYEMIATVLLIITLAFTIHIANHK